MEEIHLDCKDEVKDEILKMKTFEKQKSSSTSSIFLHSTMNTPNAKNLINAISTIILSQIVEDEHLGKVISPKSDLFYFSEEKYITEYPISDENKDQPTKLPSLDDICEFIEALYNCAQFSVECCVLSLIYINRIITLTGLSINSRNWRPLVLVSLMVAQKVWDDRYLCNADFAYIYPFFDISQLNMLEMKFLEMIQYNVYVKMSLYTKYYLELKSIFPFEGLKKPLTFSEIFNMENTDIDTIVLNSEKEEEKKKKKKNLIAKPDGNSSKEDIILYERLNKQERSKSIGRDFTLGKNSFYIIN